MFTKSGLWTAFLLGFSYCFFIFYISDKNLEGTICTVKEYYLSKDNKHKYIVYNDEYGTLEVTRNNNDFQIGDKIKLGPNNTYKNLWRSYEQIFVAASMLIYVFIIIFIAAFFTFSGYIVEDNYGYIH